MIPAARTTFCFGARHGAARAIPVEVRLGDRHAFALALLVPLLGCGEEAAALAFDGLAASEGDPAAGAALRAIAEEERVHDRLLHGLAESLPPVAETALRRQARRFHIDLGRGSTLAHLARIAAIDAGVCMILSRLLRPASPVAGDRAVADMLARIRLDETRHVRLSRSLVLARADGRGFEDVAKAAREALANVIMLAADAFEDLEVDPVRLWADLGSLPHGLLRR
ncbi:MAG: 3-oxoacyl-ACP synthase [Novosphingobium sp.]